MNLLQRSGASLALGLATYGVCHAGAEYIEIEPEVRNGTVAACAAQLGETAVQSEILPLECIDYERAFDSTVTSRSKFSAKTQTSEIVDKTVVYSLPSATEFSEINTVTATGADEHKRAVEMLARTAGVLGTVVYFGSLYPIRNKSNN